MRNYWPNESPPHLISVATSPCELDNRQKQCSKWLLPALTRAEWQQRHWCTTAAVTAWSSLAHSVLMRCLRSSRSVMRISYTFMWILAHSLHTIVKLDLNLASLEATVEAEWMLAFLYHPDKSSPLFGGNRFRGHQIRDQERGLMDHFWPLGYRFFCHLTASRKR